METISLRFIWVSIMLSVACSNVSRSTRTQVSLEGGFSRSTDRGARLSSFDSERRGCVDCDVEFTSEAHHEQFGGVARVGHHDGSGLNLGAHFAALHGKTRISFLEDTFFRSPESYTPFEAGGYAGYDFEYWGVDIGVSCAMEFDVGSYTLWPILRFRAGLLEKYWGEVATGSPSILQHGSLLSFAFKAHPHPIFRGEFGISFIGGLPITTATGLSNTRRNPGHGPNVLRNAPEVFLNLSFDLSGGFGLLVGGQLALTESDVNGGFKLGFFYEFVESNE